MDRSIHMKALCAPFFVFFAPQLPHTSYSHPLPSHPLATSHYLNLQLYRKSEETIGASEIGGHVSRSRKDIHKNPFDVIPTLFGYSSNSFEQKIDLVSVDDRCVRASVSE